jgi:hypothetical protein
MKTGHAAWGFGRHVGFKGQSEASWLAGAQSSRDVISLWPRDVLVGIAGEYKKVASSACGVFISSICKHFSHRPRIYSH